MDRNASEDLIQFQHLFDQIEEERARILAQISPRQYAIETRHHIERTLDRKGPIPGEQLLDTFLRICLVLELNVEATGLQSHEIRDLTTVARTVQWRLEFAKDSPQFQWLTAILESALRKQASGEWMKQIKDIKIQRASQGYTKPTFMEIAYGLERLNLFDTASAVQSFERVLAGSFVGLHARTAAVNLLACLRFAGDEGQWRSRLLELRRKFSGDPAAALRLDWEEIFGNAFFSRSNAGLRLSTSPKRPHRRMLPLLLSRLLLLTRGEDGIQADLPSVRVLKKMMSRDTDDVDAWTPCEKAFAGIESILSLPREDVTSVPLEEIAEALDAADKAPNVEFRLLYQAAFASILRDSEYGDVATALEKSYRDRSLRLSGGKGDDLYRLLSLGESDGPTALIHDRDLKWISQTLVAGKLAVGIGTARVRAKIASKISPQKTESHRAREISRCSDIIREELAVVKGPLLKFVQALPYLDEVLPPQIAAELRRITEYPRHVAPDDITRQVEQELGAPIDRLFSEWQRIPFAAASLGQVHRARTLDGREVAVKVQYPHIKSVIDRQLLGLKLIAPAARILFPSVDTTSVLAELGQMLIQEVDYRREARWQSTVRSALAGWSGVFVPEVFPDYSTERILTSSLVSRGVRLREFVHCVGSAERSQAAERIFRTYWHLRFVHNLLNTDPHPGNFLFDEAGVYLIDFGGMQTAAADINLAYDHLVGLIAQQDRAGSLAWMTEHGFLQPGKVFDQEAVWRQIKSDFAAYSVDGPFAFMDAQLIENFQQVGRQANHWSLRPEWMAHLRSRIALHNVMTVMKAEGEFRRWYLESTRGDAQTFPRVG